MPSSFDAAGLGARILHFPDDRQGNVTEVDGSCLVREIVRGDQGYDDVVRIKCHADVLRMNMDDEQQTGLDVCVWDLDEVARTAADVALRTAIALRTAATAESDDVVVLDRL